MLVSNIGIGDIILSRLYADILKVTSIHFNFEYIETYRDGSIKYKIFILQLIDRLLSEFNITTIGIKEAANEPLPRLDNLSRYLTEFSPEKFFNFPYILLSTRMGRIPVKFYQDNREKIFKILSELPFQVILVGERTSSESKERKTLTSSKLDGCLYQDFKNIPGIIDMTTDADLSINASIDKFYQECYLTARSLATIHMGIGGFFCTSLTLTRIFSFCHTDRTKDNQTVNSLSKYEHQVIFTSIDQFESFFNRYINIFKNIYSLEYGIVQVFIKHCLNDKNYVGNLNILADEKYSLLVKRLKDTFMFYDKNDKNDNSGPLIVVSDDIALIKEQKNLVLVISEKEDLIEAKSVFKYQDWFLYLTQ